MAFMYVLVALILGSVGSVTLAGMMLLLKSDKLDRVSTLLMYLFA